MSFVRVEVRILAVVIQKGKNSKSKLRTCSSFFQKPKGEGENADENL